MNPSLCRSKSLVARSMSGIYFYSGTARVKQDIMR